MRRVVTVGLLASGITDNFSIMVCRGAMTAAREMGARLVIFPGKYLDRDLTARKEILYEYQYNTLFFLCGGKTAGCRSHHGGQYWLLCAGGPGQIAHTALQRDTVCSDCL